MIYALDEQYFVRALRQSDLEGPYPGWFEDQAVTQFSSHGKFARTNQYFQAYLNQIDRDDQLVWAICHESDGHIGNICLQAINFINRNADFGVLMGNKKHWGKGVAFKAMKTILSHGFYKLNLERIYCGTAANNEAMRAIAQKIGMIEEGRWRSHLYIEGQWVDMIQYGILRDECPRTI